MNPLPPPHRILIADDEAKVRALCRLILESEEWRRDEAANGPLARVAARAKGYDLVLLDVDIARNEGH